MLEPCPTIHNLICLNLRHAGRNKLYDKVGAGKGEERKLEKWNQIT